MPKGNEIILQKRHPQTHISTICNSHDMEPAWVDAKSPSLYLSF